MYSIVNIKCGESIFKILLITIYMKDWIYSKANAIRSNKIRNSRDMPFTNDAYKTKRQATKKWANHRITNKWK